MIKFQGSPDRKALSTLCNNATNIPISPTANLKLLTKVASELVSPVPSIKAPARNVNVREPDSRTRKDKSLGILCDRFLAMFPLNLPDGCQGMTICLDQVAEQLGIVKRRIYDIINILESLHMASKVAKNRYHWHGCNNLQATLSQLKVMALEFGIDDKLQDIQAKQKKGYRLVSGPTCCCSENSSSIISSNADERKSTARPGDGFFSDERTLGVMCLKFIMLFLASPQSSAKINLDLATRMLVSEAAESSERQLWGMRVECHRTVGDPPCEIGSKTCKCMLRLKTKVRRLYDIANVLTSLGLIAKIDTATNSMRKPVFVYTGPFVRMKPAQGTPAFTFKNFSVSSYEEDEGIENKLNMSHKRKDVKFKGGPPEKFPRMSSASNFDISHERCSTSYNISARHIPASQHSRYQCSLDDILQVAGEELEKIRSSEESAAAAEKLSSARKKLSFSRCHSDSCIQPGAVQKLMVNERKDPIQGICSGSTVVPEVSSATVKNRVCITLTDTKSKRFTITRKLVEVPVNALTRKSTKDQSLGLHNITPMQAQTLSTLFNLSSQKAQREGSNWQSSKMSAVRADILNNNKPAVQPVVNSVKRVAICPPPSSPIPSAVSPGEVYRAIKVGNVVRLVPLMNTVVVDNSEQL